jgi:predicted transcriptional regulator
MSPEQLIWERHHALTLLVQCARYLRERDAIIRRAAKLGISKTEIAQILGMSRSHVSMIANSEETQ